MPAILREVSGIAYIDDNRFACVQDESGVIFIYNTKTKKIEQQITFGAAGDYEGIALVKNIAYVVRSDGKVFEVNDITTRSPHIKEYSTPLTTKNNVEGVAYDRKGNRLLLAIKGNETDEANFKGIYGFDLKSKTLAVKPVYKIDLNDSLLEANSGKKVGTRIQPSDIAIHPSTGDIYLLEGTNPQLFILDPTGRLTNRYKLPGSGFSQPEGLDFSPNGDLYISNEGKKEAGNILKVQVD
ncbi:MAG: hypothetical protein JWQ14_3387 [Adhaeribacter sp.]|nr:hypothetical protein [Adhaeribacter sp.]